MCYVSQSDPPAMNSASLCSSLHSCGTQSVLILSGPNKKLIPIQRMGKKDKSPPFTMKDVDQHITNCTSVSVFSGCILTV